MFRTIFLNLALLAIFLFHCQGSGEKNRGELPDLTLLDTKGGEVNLKEYSDKVLILDFWATWCEPCKESVPVLEKLQEKSQGEVAILGINTDQNKSPEYIQAHADALGMTYTSLLDTHHILVDYLELEGLPGIFVYSSSGKLLYKQYGIRESDLVGLLARISSWKSAK